MMSSTARAVTAAIGCTTAVNGGWLKRAIGVSSKLTSDRSPGTSRLRPRASSSVASAIWSLLAITAVARGSRPSSASAARRPAA